MTKHYPRSHYDKQQQDQQQDQQQQQQAGTARNMVQSIYAIPVVTRACTVNNSRRKRSTISLARR